MTPGRVRDRELEPGHPCRLGRLRGTHVVLSWEKKKLPKVSNLKQLPYYDGFIARPFSCQYKATRLSAYTKTPFGSSYIVNKLNIFFHIENTIGATVQRLSELTNAQLEEGNPFSSHLLHLETCFCLELPVPVSLSPGYAGFLDAVCWKVLQQLADGHGFPPSTARRPPAIMLPTVVEVKYTYLDNA